MMAHRRRSNGLQNSNSQPGRELDVEYKTDIALTGVIAYGDCLVARLLPPRFQLRNQHLQQPSRRHLEDLDQQPRHQAMAQL